MIRWRHLASLLALTSAAALLRAADTPPPAAVVVDRVLPGGAAAASGLRTGDQLVRWERGDAGGPLQSPFDLADVELEEGPRGPVRLLGQREGEPLAVTLFPDDWRVQGRPILSADATEAYTEARRRLDAGQTDAGIAALRALPAGAGIPDLEAWLLLEVARAQATRHDLDAVAAAVEEAVGAARAADRPHTEAQLLTFLGSTLREADRMDAAAAALDRALAVRRQSRPDGLATTALADPITTVARAREAGTAEARALLEQAVAVQERLAPESLALARSLVALGWLLPHSEQKKETDRAAVLVEKLAPESLLMARVLFARSWTDSGGDVEWLTRALAIQERLAPEDPPIVNTIFSLASELAKEGDRKRAIELYGRARTLAERIAPGSSYHAAVLNSMAAFWFNLGDLIQSEPLYRQAVEISERRRPGGFRTAAGLYNLGQLFARRRDFEQAERHFQRARELLKEENSLGGRILYALGEVRRERGDLKGAEAMLGRSLDVLARASPSQVANVRQYLADTLVDGGRYDEAEALYRQNVEAAVATKEADYMASERHHSLAALALQRGDLDIAERHHALALEMRREKLPDTFWHAQSSHGTGVVRRRRGRQEEALALFQEAVAALEAQGRRLGGSEETRARFRAHYQQYYRDLEDLLLELGREREAFAVVERSRSRGMLALLSARDLTLGGGVPDELERRRSQTDAEYDRLFRALHAPGIGNAARDDALRGELAAARQAQDDVRARIAAVAPRVAAIRDPTPLDVEGMRQVIDPGTVLLAFSLGETRSHVYALGPAGLDLAVVSLGAGSGALREEVRAFRDAIDARRTPLLQAGMVARSRRLTELLLKPVADRLRRADRVLIVPDGALHVLPFAALQDPTVRGPRYLVESKPVQIVSSVTLYHRWLAGSTDAPSAATQVVGFGDPVYRNAGTAASPAPQTAPALTRAQASGLRLTELPGTRREVVALKALAADARLWLGADATEERAKALDRSARVVHFACHGFLDERLPLESGLLLTLPPADAPNRDNGILQAWEVFENVRIDAELVTLSACQTGLGEEMAGEGLLGLTWAFQYAGARTVLASLWEVSDGSTTDLMARFYRHLAAGVTKAEALRRAQADLRRRPATSAPYYWAAFTLNGGGR